MAEESLIPEAARAMIGQTIGTPVHGDVLQKETQRYAHAVGDENPLYFDAEYARAAGYRDIIAPPLYVEIFQLDSVPLSELRKDGISKARQAPIPLKVNRVMAGGEAVEFFEPIYPGDTLRGETRLVSVSEKTGRSGPFVLVERETTYTNQDGIVVIKSRSTSIVR